MSESNSSDECPLCAQGDHPVLLADGHCSCCGMDFSQLPKVVFSDGREPLDTTQCPDPNKPCGRKSSSGEILYCPYHYNKIFLDVARMDWLAHLDVCERCNLNLVCMTCEIGLDSGEIDTPQDHSCNCMKGLDNNGAHIQAGYYQLWNEENHILRRIKEREETKAYAANTWCATSTQPHS